MQPVRVVETTPPDCGGPHIVSPAQGHSTVRKHDKSRSRDGGNGKFVLVRSRSAFGSLVVSLVFDRR